MWFLCLGPEPYLKDAIAERGLVQAIAGLGSCEKLVCQFKAACGVGVKNAVTVEGSIGRAVILFREEAHVGVSHGLTHPICQLAVPVHGHGSHTDIAKTNDLPSIRPKITTITSETGCLIVEL